MQSIRRLVVILTVGMMPAFCFGQASDRHTVFNSLSGSIGFFEIFFADMLDRLMFSFGLHENIEAIIRSDIPTQVNPFLNFYFVFQH